MAELMSAAEANNRAVAADRIANRIEDAADKVRQRPDLIVCDVGVPVALARLEIALAFARNAEDKWWAEINEGRVPSERTRQLVVELLTDRLDQAGGDPFAGLPS